MVLFPWRLTWLESQINKKHSIFFFFCSSLANNKKFTSPSYRLQQRIHEKKILAKVVRSLSFIYLFERCGGGLSYDQVKLMQFWMKFSTYIFIVRIEKDIDEREQIDLRFIYFFNESLLLFFFLKLVLTLNDVSVSLDCDNCKTSKMQR